MAIAVAQARHVFGVRASVVGSVCYIDEQTIFYPAGANCILYNIDQRSQKFIPCSEKSEGVTAITVSPNRRYAAIAEKGEKATVTVYDLHTLRKRKILSNSDMQSTEFTTLAFSPDSKYLIAQGGKPDWILMYWTWEKSKVMAKISTTNPQGNVINHIAFNPQDNTQISIVGNGIFKLYRYTEGNMKQIGFQKVEPLNFTSHAWLSEDRVIVGTDQGRVMLFESGELKHDFNVGAPPPSMIAGKETERSGMSSAAEVEPTRAGLVSSMVAYSKGFVVASGGGVVHLFEKTDENMFKKTREIKIPQDTPPGDTSKFPSHEIRQLALSPSEETLICSTDTHQLYSITLSSTDIGRHTDHASFELLSHSFHHGTITGMDICIRKPYIATCSLDRSIRIWNYETDTLELWKEFQEDAYSIALHPSGLFVLVGFSDKLRLMNLLIDDIRMFKEFTIRGCRECSFSNGGHLFAAVQGNVIQIYSCSTFENVLNLKGHNGKVRQTIWTPDDSKMITCGMDGAVYEWDTFTGKRLGESVLKSCSYTGVTVTPDGKTTFAVGSDKTLKEISDSQILRDVDASSSTLTQIAMSHSGRMLFCGTSTGTLRSVKFPLTIPGEWTEHQAHVGAITRMKISFCDQYLFTVSDDACLILWKISDKEGRTMKREKELTYAEEILITKSDLEEKNALMSELKTRVDELKMENEYQLRLKDMNYNEKIKELTEKFIQEMESLKTKNQVLKTEKDKMEAKHEEELAEIMEKQSKELQDLESANNQKLMLEYEKYQELQAKSQKMQEDYERQLGEMEESKERALEELTEYYEAKLQEKIQQLEQANDESRQQSREYEETKKQIEEDADREILDIKNKYEKRLRDEKEAYHRLKGDNGIMKKKFTSLQKEIDDHKTDINRLNAEQTKLNSVIKSLEKDIVGLKKEIQERDETIQDKEKRIYDLKKKNQELEKFKFVLDYKIKELKKQIEPKDKDIKDMKEQIQEMESELERFHKQNQQLQLNITELRQKLKATESEMHMERQRVRDLEAVNRRFQTDLHNTVGYIQEPKLLKESIKALYQKYATGDTPEAASVDADIQSEYARQREHLERSVASLRKKLSKDTEIHRADNVRIMQENVTLIKEINDLRKELKVARTTVHDLEAQVSLNRRKQLNLPDIAQSAPPARREALSASTLRGDEESKRIIEIQKEEIRKLRAQMYELEQQLSLRPPSQGRIPAPIQAQ